MFHCRVQARGKKKGDAQFAEAFFHSVRCVLNVDAQFGQYIGGSAFAGDSVGAVFCDCDAGTGNDKGGCGGDVECVGAVAAGSDNVNCVGVVASYSGHIGAHDVCASGNDFGCFPRFVGAP